MAGEGEEFAALPERMCLGGWEETRGGRGRAPGTWLSPRGIVIGTLLGMVLHVRFSPDDQQVAVCAGNCIYMLSAKVWDYSTGQLIYQSGVLTGEGRNTSKLCKTNNMRPERTVETSLPILLIEHCDFLVCSHNEENISSALNTTYFWIGTSTGLLIINLANFELEGFLSYKDYVLFGKDYSDLSIRSAGSCALTQKAVNGKVLCLITSMFEDMIAVLEVNLAGLVRTQQSDFLPCGNEKNLSVIARMTMFSPKNNLKKSEVSKWKTTCRCKNKEYPLESYPPTKYEKEISVTSKPTRICCIQYSGDGEMLACGLADKAVLIFNSNLTDTCNVFSGHDGAVNSVGWSHNKKWLVSASEDRTLRVWSVCKNEPVLILGKEKFHKTVRFAQFYFMDAFILLCCGAEFHLLSFHLDTTKDDLKRYKQRSVCKLVQKFPMASTMEITSLSAVNDFYSQNCTDIILTAGSNRALEVFDLNAGCSTAVIPEAHTRSVYQICQNKGSSFSTQQPEAYNLFMTTAAGDGIKLWDLRTLRCERRFEGHSSHRYPCGIAVSPCGQFIASGSDDKCAYIYEMHSSTFSHKLGGHTESVINVAFSPSSPQISCDKVKGFA
ncbi:wd repeat-containing protein 27 [Limosa lapponica baueri]|uniref:Wd repeat-containing protein 27 n=1 Tax=Limosa lapponica baueri TaxID=1758121 RepID=A0A2I0UNZ9_LIMLA|nr:wd repeat-containing protein 27 [Limosa lapponica baueri]